MAARLVASSLGLLLALVGAAPTSTDAFQQRCLSFQPETYIDNSTTTVREFITAGTNLSLPDNDASCNRSSQVVSVDMCRIALFISTSERSNITSEMWLPRNWTGRFLATGNSGVDGCIKYEDLAYTTQNGFASVGANNGHNGTSGKAFYQNEDVVIDFSWRSLHTATDVGKKLTKLFYDSDITRSYFMSCSLGGRQGINAADMFPDDYDGIVAGAPSIDFNNLVSWRASFFPITGPVGSPTFIPNTTWKTTIHNAVLAQCDLLDGVADGILEDPTLCHFNPDPLLCNATTSPPDCLTPTQLTTLRAVLSPLLAPNGTLLYPAMQPGSEIAAADRLYAGVPFAYSVDWFRYALYDPTWSPASFTPADALVADARNLANVRTWPATLAPFADRGGRLLMYHGLQDPQITSAVSTRFYERLRNGGSYAEMDKWLRLFRVSGMNHCNGGPGAWVLGQGGGQAAEGVGFARERNVLAAVVAWVEGGTPPETVTGTKFVGDVVGRGVAFERAHCRWPYRNTFLGGGRDPGVVGSWECRWAGEGEEV